jgi:hypothetical protein
MTTAQLLSNQKLNSKEFQSADLKEMYTLMT